MWHANCGATGPAVRDVDELLLPAVRESVQALNLGASPAARARMGGKPPEPPMPSGLAQLRAARAERHRP
jgi:hypothetical protein